MKASIKRTNAFINILLGVSALSILLILITGGGTFELGGIKVTADVIDNPMAFMIGLFFLKIFIHPAFEEKMQRSFSRVSGNRRLLYFVFLGFFGLILFLNLMHFLFPDKTLWDLDSEHGLGTVASVGFLLLTALLCILIFTRESRLKMPGAKSWIPVMAIFSYLMLDELIAIHEVISSPRFLEKAIQAHPLLAKLEWLNLYAPFFLAAGAFLAYFMFKKFFRRKNIFLILVLASLCYFAGLFSEAVMLGGELRGTAVYRIQVAGEESLEMLGTVLFMLAFFLYYQILQMNKQQTHQDQ